MKTINELAQEVLDVQDTCNLCGVAQSFAEAMSTLMQIAYEQEKGTAWVNTHPITKMWVEKLVSLSEYEDKNYGGRYMEVQMLAKG